MYKKCILWAGLMLSYAAVRAEGVSLQVPAVFAFDLHDVITVKNKGAMTKEILSLLVHYPLRSMRLLKKLHAWRHLEKKETLVAEEILAQHILNDPDLRCLQKRLHKLLNAHTVNPRMKALLEMLAGQGHVVILASNIGPSSLALYRPVLERAGMWQLFSAVVSPRSDNQMAHKPQPAFYKELHQQALRLAPHAPIFLIDDKENNIVAAADYGINGHRFTTPDAFVAWLEKEAGVSVLQASKTATHSK